MHAGEGVDIVAAVKDLTGGGPDYAFEAIGSERDNPAGLGVCPRGRHRHRRRVDAQGHLADDRSWQLISEKTIKGSSSAPRGSTDIPRLVDLTRAGELELDQLVRPQAPLSELPEAFDRLRAGDVVRQVVVF